MAQTYKSNATGLIFALEDGQGNKKTGENYHRQGFSTIGTSGDNVSVVQSDTINQDRQHHKGTPSSKSSEFSFTADGSVDTIRAHAEQALFGVSSRKGGMDLLATSTTASSNTITFPANVLTPALRTNGIIDDGTLIYIATGRNKGFKKVSSTTATTIVVDGTFNGGISVNDAGVNVNVSVAGIVTDQDVRWAYTSASKTAVISFDNGEGFTLNNQDIKVGQWAFIGIPDSMGNPTNGLTNTVANDMWGYARVISVATNSITFDNVSPRLRFSPAAVTSTPVAVRFSEYTTNALVNETGFEFTPYLWEIQYNKGGARNAQGVSPDDIFNYPTTQYLNTMNLTTPLSSKTTIDFAFVGLNTQVNVQPADRIIDPTSDVIEDMYRNDIMSTSVGQQRAVFEDEDGNDLGSVFTNINLSINNNVTAQDILFQLDHYEVNYGMLSVTADITALFTSDIPSDAIRNNRSGSLNYVVDSPDGAMVIDVYSATLSGGDKSFTAGANIPVNFSMTAHSDNIFGRTMGMSSIVGPMPSA